MRGFALALPVLAGAKETLNGLSFLKKRQPDHHDAAVTDLAAYKVRGNDVEPVAIFDVQDDTTEANLGTCKEAQFVDEQPEFEYFKLCGVNKKLMVYGQHKCDDAFQGRKAELGLCSTKINAENCVTINSGSDANAWLGTARSWKVVGCDYVEQAPPPPVQVEGGSATADPVVPVVATEPPETETTPVTPEQPEATKGNIKQLDVSPSNPFAGTAVNVDTGKVQSASRTSKQSSGSRSKPGPSSRSKPGPKSRSKPGPSSRSKPGPKSRSKPGPSSSRRRGGIGGAIKSGVDKARAWRR